MKRYSWERGDLVAGEPCVFVLDARRGGPGAYDRMEDRALAICANDDDAQLIVDALNAQETR